MGAVHPAAIYRTGGVTVTAGEAPGRGGVVPSGAIKVMVNGDPSEVREGATVEQLVTETTALTSGVAAAVNGEVVPRGSWAARVLHDGDQVEIVTAVQGG
jgi:sulfur carrier protein